MTHPGKHPSPDDDLQLTALFDRMCAAWTAGDAAAYAACFTEDCDYVSFDGNRAQGRAASSTRTTSCSQESSTAARWSAAWRPSATSPTTSP
jgi:uncharacterized protein (TIGR02246 family)